MNIVDVSLKTVFAEYLSTLLASDLLLIRDAVTSEVACHIANHFAANLALLRRIVHTHVSLQEVPASESFGANVANVLRISVQILEMGLVTCAIPEGFATKLAIDFLQDVNTLNVTDEFALGFDVLAARVANERFVSMDSPASSFESIVVQLSGGFDSIDAGFRPFEDDLRRQPLQ